MSESFQLSQRVPNMNSVNFILGRKKLHLSGNIKLFYALNQKEGSDHDQSDTKKLTT